MVNSATGEAASASMDTVLSSGPGRRHCRAEASAPRAIDQGMGLVSMPRSARRSATAMPWVPAPSSRDSAMHSEVVSSMSTSMVRMAGPAACAPSSATSSGTPMKPVLGKAATSAPKAASFQPMRARVSATMPPTITRAHSTYTPATTGSSSCPMGVLEPKRNSMHGSAKNSTKAFSPGMAGCGSVPLRAAR